MTECTPLVSLAGQNCCTAANDCLNVDIVLSFSNEKVLELEVILSGKETCCFPQIPKMKKLGVIQDVVGFTTGVCTLYLHVVFTLGQQAILKI